MSHTLTIKTKFTDPEAIRQTCRELGIAEPTRGKIRMFDGKEIADGYAVTLPGWREPVAIDAETGEAFFDNYNGAWGDQKHLDRFTQLYATNAATNAAEALGYQVSREYADNGSIKLTVSGY